MSDEDRAKLEALDAAMEANLNAGAAPTSVAVAATGSAPVVQLNAGALAATPAEQKKARAFGAGAEDFYPTEQKAKIAIPKP